jgi:hypothetical protein
MRLVNGIWTYASWESYIIHYKTLQLSSNAPAGQRLAKRLANEIEVTLALLDESTLEWDYKCTLIKPKEFQQLAMLMDMLVSHLEKQVPSSALLQAALHLRGAWRCMEFRLRGAWRCMEHQRQIKKDKHKRYEQQMERTKNEILKYIELMLSELRINCNV